jgi:uncharacterized protein (TIGR03067 family)
MRTCAFLLLASLSGSAIVLTGTPAPGAPVPKHLMKDGDNTEQGKLQGKWRLTSIRLGGTEIGGNVAAGIEMTMEIRGDTLTANVMQGPTQRVTAKIKLDTADGVKRFSTTNTQKTDADGKPNGREEDVTCGYAIDGDKMTWAMVPGANGKAELADPAKPGANAILMVFTRVKEKN